MIDPKRFAAPLPAKRLMDRSIPYGGDRSSGLGAPSAFGLSILARADLLFAVEPGGARPRLVKGSELLRRIVDGLAVGAPLVVSVEVANDPEFDWLRAVVTLVESDIEVGGSAPPVEPAGTPVFGRPLPVHSLIDPSRSLENSPRPEFQVLGPPTREALETLRDADVVWAIDAVYPIQRVAVKGGEWWKAFTSRLGQFGLTDTANVVCVEVDFDGPEFSWLSHMTAAANDPGSWIWQLA